MFETIHKGFLAILTTGLLMTATHPPIHAYEITHPVYAPDTTIVEDAVKDYLEMAEPDLLALITADGGTEANIEMRRVTYEMACLYQTTGSEAYAERAVALLQRFSEVVPAWPMTYGDGRTASLDQVDWGDWSNGGLWGIWHHQDQGEARELVLAYDLVASSEAMERRGPDAQRRVTEDLLRYMAEFSLRSGHLVRVYGPHEDGRAPFDFGNMGGNTMEGLIPFGKVVDPRYVHLVVDWLRRYPSVAYFRDGIWHESSPSYHEQISGRVARRLPKQLKGYSDPPGYVHPVTGIRFDDLDVEAGLESQFERIRGAMKHLTLPNDHLLTLHDTHSTQRSWHVEKETSTSHCYFGMRHAVLGRFSGENQAQAHFHFGGTDGHEHLDCLSLTLWALGEELLSEGEYKSFGNRDWNTSTPGHNLVVVDGMNQRGRFADRQEASADDAIDGLAYNPGVHGHGDSRNYGNLRLWDPTHPGIHVVEAEGENAYGKEVTPLYRRTLAMVEIDEEAFYLIDLFRVKGGQTHDWMLHGRLNEDYRVETTVDTRPHTETRFKHLRIERKADTGDTWWSEFTTANGASIRTTVVGQPGTEVGIGRAPAMRREGTATFLDVRRRNGDNLFAVVHEPYRGRPKVRSITPLVYSGRADSVVCLQIDLEGGRTDYFASTLDQPPYPEHRIPGTDLSFRGRAVHVATRGDTVLWTYLLEGCSISVNGVALSASEGDLSHRGTVTATARVERGDPWNGFNVDGSLPADGSLNGRTLLLTLGDGRTEGYTINRVEGLGDGSRVHVNEEPGMELRDDGRLAKLVYFPWHGVRGPVQYLISGSLYRDGAGGVRSSAPVRVTD